MTTTTIYSDLLKVGANMSNIDQNGVGTEFVFNAVIPLFNEYDSVNNAGLTLSALAGHKSIVYISTYFKLNQNNKINLSSISYLDANMDELITVTNSPYIWEGEDPGSTRNIYEGNDTIIGNRFNDFLRGGIGNDSLIGNAGNDRLLGDSGNDFLAGSVGADTLVGGLGTDVLRGGSGADRFVFENTSDSVAVPNYSDMIADFSVKQKDIIDLSAIDAISSTIANEKFTFIGSNSFSGSSGQLRFSIEQYMSGNNILMLSGDVNGDGIADFGISIPGISTLAISSINL